jgi:Glycosyl transferase family 11
MYQSGGKLILNCSGGLGNQMFEYAAGLYFAAQLNKQLEVVQPLPQHAQWNGFSRPFQLSQFAIRSKIRGTTFLDRLFFSTNPQLRSFQLLLGKLVQAELVEEPAIYRFHADLTHKVNQKTIYLNGFWQSAAYVTAVEATLRKEYRFTSPAKGKNEDYLDQICRLKCPISIHLRIGDYALINHHVSSSAMRVSMVLKKNYYAKAISFITELFPEHTLVVFSDDQQVAKGILPKKKEYLFIEGNDAMNAYNDLRLMSHCRHHIIANSSFSWWGAWLNPNPDKKVFAPQYWANTRHSYFPDLYPDGWTIIDNVSP